MPGVDLNRTSFMWTHCLLLHPIDGVHTWQMPLYTMDYNMMNDNQRKIS